MRDLEQRIRLKIMVMKDMSMSEIQAEMIDIPDRSVYRAVKSLVKSEEIVHKKIIGKHGKRKRYTMAEEKTDSDVTIRALDLTSKEIKNNNLSEDELLSRVIRVKRTQKQLSQLINSEIKLYHKEIKRIAQFGEDTEYYYYHVSLISSSLEWTMKLTMAINSGMFGMLPQKTNLARQNRERYEDFVGLLCNNIKKYNEKRGENIIKQIYAELDKLWIMENLKFN
jgi:hypothetical protein